MPDRDADAATEQIADNLRHLSADQLVEQTLGAARGIAQPLMTSDGQACDRLPVRKTRIEQTRRQPKRWPRRASRRKKGSPNH
jgi:putative transposase